MRGGAVVEGAAQVLFVFLLVDLFVFHGVAICEEDVGVLCFRFFSRIGGGPRRSARMCA